MFNYKSFLLEVSKNFLTITTDHSWLIVLSLQIILVEKLTLMIHILEKIQVSFTYLPFH